MNKLSEETARLISSSQVVTSISNVVKELLENSLDAEASNVDVKLENFGLNKIEVRDNGCGIKSTDVGFAAQHGYTSKISSHLDLQDLSTYGFRGEALGSICEVSDVTITTRTKDELYSTVYVLDSKGIVKSKKPSHISQGTTITVSNLFKNLPVRKQFYNSTKKLKEQLKLTEDLLISFAVAQPNVQLKLTNDRKVVWQKTKSSSTRSAFMQILGGNLQINEIEMSENGINLKVFLPKQSVTRKSGDRCIIVVNKRPVRDKKMEKLLRQYCNQNEEKCSGWPAVLAMIEVPSDSIDVNVNANKSEVMLTMKAHVLEMLNKLLGPEETIQECEDENYPESRNSSKTEELEIPTDPTNDFSAQQDHGLRIQNFMHLNNESISLSKSVITGQKVSGHSNNDNVGGDSDICGMDNVITLDVVSHAEPYNDNVNQPSTRCSNAIREAQQNDEQDCHISENRTENNQSGIISNNNINVSSSDHDCLFVSEECTGNLLQSTQVVGDLDTVPNFPDFTLSLPLEEVNNHSKVEESNNPGSEAWSRGTAVKDDDRNIIAPVNILRGPVIGKSSNSKTTKKRSIADASLNQSTLDGIVEISRAKKPRSVFEICRNETGEEWDKLSSEKRKSFVATASKEYDEHMKKQKKSERSNKKRNSFILQNEDEESDDYHEATEIPLATNLNQIKQSLKGLKLQNKPEMSLVGFLEENKFAILCVNSKFFIVNLHRLQENVVFENLLQNHKLSCVDLEFTLEINEENIGQEGMEILQSLSFTAPTLLNPDGELTDERITWNGFKIRKSSNCVFELYSLTTNIPYYGLSDLKEILSKINNKSGLKGSRPAKVIYYLQGEAARVTRSSPIRYDKLDLMKIIYALKKRKSNLQKLFSSVCFHEKPIFYKIGS